MTSAMGGHGGSRSLVSSTEGMARMTPSRPVCDEHRKLRTHGKEEEI